MIENEKTLLSQIDQLRLEDWNVLFKSHPQLVSSTLEQLKSEDLFSPFFFPSSSAVFTIIEGMETLGLTYSFDWMKWDEGRLMIENKQTDFNTLGIIDLIKLLNAIIRNERMVEDYLFSLIESGTIYKILRAIKINRCTYLLHRD